MVTGSLVDKDVLCNAWELSLSWEQVAEAQSASDEKSLTDSLLKSRQSPELLQDRIAKLEWFINKFIGEGTYLNMLNGLTQGDSYWERIVNEYKTWREELVR